MTPRRNVGTSELRITPADFPTGLIPDHDLNYKLRVPHLAFLHNV